MTISSFRVTRKVLLKDGTLRQKRIITAIWKVGKLFQSKYLLLYLLCFSWCQRPIFLLVVLIVELAERSPIIIQNSSNPSSPKKMDVRPYDHMTIQGATFNMCGQLYCESPLLQLTNQNCFKSFLFNATWVTTRWTDESVYTKLTNWTGHWLLTWLWWWCVLRLWKC